MECEICNHNYNQTKKRPTVLYPCCHTFCSKCLDNWSEKTCPTCRIEIKDKNINWGLFKMIPEVNPNKIKQKNELEKLLKEAERLDKTFDQILNEKLKQTKKKFNKLKDEVNKKYNNSLKAIRDRRKERNDKFLSTIIAANKMLHYYEVQSDFKQAKIEMIKQNEDDLQLYNEHVIKFQSSRKKFHEDISIIEKELIEMLHKIQSHSSDKFNFDAVKKIHEAGELDSDQISEFNKELKVKISRLNTQLEDLNTIDIENRMNQFFLRVSSFHLKT